MLTIAAAVVVIYFVNAKVYGPEHQVRSYFQALRDGEGERALGLLGARVPEGNPAVLDGEALKASAADLEVLDIAEPASAGDRKADVTVRYSIDGREEQTTFRLQRADRDWLFFDHWTFVPTALPTFTVVSPGQQEATLNGTRVALQDEATTFTAFYPTKLDASFTTEYFAAPSQTGVITSPQDTVQLTLKTAATESLVAAVDAEVREFLDGCTAGQDRLAPAGCPFFHYTDSKMDLPIVWEITAYPQVDIRPVAGDWVLAPLSGRASLSATQTDLFSGVKSALNVEKDFSFAASLRVDGNGVSITPAVD